MVCYHPINYESLIPCYYDQNRKFIVQQDGLYGVIDLNQQIIIPVEFDYISNWVEYGPEAHFVEKEGKHGLIDRDGKIIVPPLYDEIKVDNSEIIRVKNEGLYGTVNWSHEIIHPMKYDEIQWEWPYMSGPIDTIYIKEGNRYFTTDLNGKVYEPSITEAEFLEKFGYLSN